MPEDDYFDFINPAELTAPKALRIRIWRVDQEFTWRMVAEAAADEWGWGSGGNQLFGEELCRAAAHVLGQDPQSEPWN